MDPQPTPELLPHGAGPTLAALKALDEALLKARGEMPKLIKDSSNPHFKNSYLSLEGLLEAVTPTLQANKLLISTGIQVIGDKWAIVTCLTHKGGGFRQSLFPLTDPAPQKAGSAITYAQRYQVASLLCLASEEDDDGNKASGIKSNGKAKQNGQPTSTPSVSSW
jgi:hypothetical protein